MVNNLDDMHYRPLHLRDLNAPQAKAFEAATAHEVEAEPAAPSFNEAELVAARKEAEAAGYEKGLAKGRGEIAAEAIEREKQLQSSLDGLLERLETELAAFKAEQQQQQKDVSRLVLVVASKLTGNLLRTHPIAPIEPMMDECMAMLSAEKIVQISVDEATAPLLEKHLKSRPNGANWKVQADPELRMGDAKIHWAGGVAERSQQDLWNDITRIVERALLPLPTSDETSNPNNPLQE